MIPILNFDSAMNEILPVLYLGFCRKKTKTNGTKIRPHANGHELTVGTLTTNVRSAKYRAIKRKYGELNPFTIGF